MGISNASLTEYDQYNRLSPVECWKLNILAVYCVILFTSSIIINGSLMLVFIKTKELRTPVNLYLIVFTILSLIASFSEGPFVIASNFSCR